MFLVIENTPGYLPDSEPAEFTEYAEAVAYMNELAAEYENDPDGDYTVEYGIASRDNFAAVIVHDNSRIHDLGRVIEVIRDDDDDEEEEA